MSLNFESLYSLNAQNMKKSVIRELLKLTNNPNIISFAGGLPAPSTFPAPKIKELTDKVLKFESFKALQYGATEGDTDLRKELIKFVLNKNKNLKLDIDNVLVTSASQQALDLIGRVFLNPGDRVIVGLPSYVGGLGAFNAYRPELIGIPLENDGMDTEILENTLKKCKKDKKLPKFIYVIPDFQNPAGVTYSLKKRTKLIELAKEYNLLIIEDSPYRELRYNGNHIPSLLELDKNEGYVVTLFTFSKILIPGFRLGWIIAHKKLIQKFVIAKQSMDLCSPPFTQAIAREYLKLNILDDQIKNNISIYKPKKDIMLECLEKEIPKELNIRWTKPEGGLFLFVYLPENINADNMFYEAIKENVAYVIGSAFYCNGKGQNTFRLNFSYPSLEEIKIGIKRLANCIKKEIESTKEISA